MIELAGLCEKLTILDDDDALAVLDRESGTLLEHRQLRKDPRYKTVWDRSYANEHRRLCQGIATGNKAGGERVAGTNTFHLITFADIPHHKRKEIIYTKVVCEICEGKDDENRTRITVGGNLICYPGNAGTNTVSLELIKLMLKGVISRKGARFACIDIQKFYLDMPMEDPEYVRIKITDISEEFILVGAVLIKTKLAYLRTKKKFHVFFSKISSYASTLKLPYATHLRTETSPPPLPRQFCRTPS